MKFMLIARYKDSYFALSQDKRKEMLDTSAQRVETLKKAGTIQELYSLGNMKGLMVIYDLNSSEDMVHIAETPLFPYMDAEITPLVEMDVVRKVQAKK